MNIGIVQFPGSNCSRETRLAIERIGHQAIDCFWHAPKSLIKSLDGYVIVGGFSYEDRVQPGVIAALEPIMKLLEEEAHAGKPLLGICNGAQILAAGSLLPPMTIAANYRKEGYGYYNTWVHIRKNSTDAKPIFLPIAHAHGRFLMSADVYASVVEQGIVCYHYCNQEGRIHEGYPINPNGSVYSLAAVSNKEGNVMAMMPHPERTPDGDAVFLEFFSQRTTSYQHTPKESSLCKFTYSPYIHDISALHYWVDLIIDDNEAISLQHALSRLNIHVTLKKLVHWQLTGANAADDAYIREHEVLFNPLKERLVSMPKSTVYIIREKSDALASKKALILKKQLGRNVNIVRDTVWVITGDGHNLEHLHRLLTNKPILGHPLAHDGFIYQ
jgi:phosphoribosylformylglycinamidine synthase I